MSYETMQTISAVLYIAGASFAAAAVILFFRWRITDTILSKTGIAKKRAKARMEARLRAEQHREDSQEMDLYEAAEEPVAIANHDERRAKPDLPAEEPTADIQSTPSKTGAKPEEETQAGPGKSQETPEEGDEDTGVLQETAEGEENTGLLEEAGDGDEDTGLLHVKKKGKQFRIVRAVVLAQGGTGDDSTDDIAEGGSADGRKGVNLEKTDC